MDAIEIGKAEAYCLQNGVVHENPDEEDGRQGKSDLVEAIDPRRHVFSLRRSLGPDHIGAQVFFLLRAYLFRTIRLALVFGRFLSQKESHVVGGKGLHRFSANDPILSAIRVAEDESCLGGIGMKRTFTRSLALALVMGALGLATGAQSKTNLVVWFPSSGNLDSAARFKFNSEFEARHPTAKVVETPQPNDNWDELFKAANLAGNGPDVVMLWPGTPTTDYASYLLPLDKYLDKPYLDSLTGWELAKVGFKSSGATLGIPSSGYVYCFWYNKAIMAKIGFDGSNPPKSYDEFLALCGKLKAKGITPVVTGTRDG
jgi:hypothetical protein